MRPPHHGFVSSPYLWPGDWDINATHIWCSLRVAMSSVFEETKGSDPESRQELRFRWVRDVDAMMVSIDFSCPVGEEEPGQIA